MQRGVAACLVVRYKETTTWCVYVPCHAPQLAPLRPLRHDQPAMAGALLMCTDVGGESAAWCQRSHGVMPCPYCR